MEYTKYTSPLKTLLHFVEKILKHFIKKRENFNISATCNTLRRNFLLLEDLDCVCITKETFLQIFPRTLKFHSRKY